MVQLVKDRAMEKKFFNVEFPDVIFLSKKKCFLLKIILKKPNLNNSILVLMMTNQHNNYFMILNIN